LLKASRSVFLNHWVPFRVSSDFGVSSPPKPKAKQKLLWPSPLIYPFFFLFSTAGPVLPTDLIFHQNRPPDLFFSFACSPLICSRSLTPHSSRHDPPPPPPFSFVSLQFPLLRTCESGVAVTTAVVLRSPRSMPLQFSARRKGGFALSDPLRLDRCDFLTVFSAVTCSHSSARRTEVPVRPFKSTITFPSSGSRPPMRFSSRSFNIPAISTKSPLPDLLRTHSKQKSPPFSIPPQNSPYGVSPFFLIFLFDPPARCQVFCPHLFRDHLSPPSSLFPPFRLVFPMEFPLFCLGIPTDEFACRLALCLPPPLLKFSCFWPDLALLFSLPPFTDGPVVALLSFPRPPLPAFFFRHAPEGSSSWVAMSFLDFRARASLGFFFRILSD